jgi:prophage regulatory protein
LSTALESYMESQPRPSLPILGTPEYEELPQYVEKPPLPFRRTIR